MSLTTPVTGGNINASDVSQLVQVLQQVSSGQEKGKYALSTGLYGNGVSATQYMVSLSRTSTPVSVSIDTADSAAGGGCTGISTASLTANGFQVFEQGTTGPNVNGHGAGNTTINF